MSKLLKTFTILFFFSTLMAGPLYASKESDCKDSGCKWEQTDEGWSCNCD